ncbi:type II toxin-antitoxin system HicB family antitoxin [Patescibacteria group bacterium]|nr:type II toxin-antitoxin system HicB family antitoxin [Patescibacteria group bacterium]
MAKKHKTILEYPAIFNKAEEGGYDVSFPDFPGCVTFGKNFEQAEEKAKELLELWIEELKENKQKIPMPKSRPIINEIPVAVFTKS